MVLNEIDGSFGKIPLWSNVLERNESAKLLDAMHIGILDSKLRFCKGREQTKESVYWADGWSEKGLKVMFAKSLMIQIRNVSKI